MKNRRCVYDEEVYPNYFAIAFKDIDSKEKFMFKIAFLETGEIVFNQINDLYHFVRMHVGYVIGYNNLGFDDPILVRLLQMQHIFRTAEPNVICKYAYDLASEIIQKQNEEEDHPSLYTAKRHEYFKSLDLMLQYNRIDRVSLKQLAVGLRWHNIIDLPVKPGTILTRGQMDEMDEYHWNDVDITEFLLFNGLAEQVNNRVKISKQFGFDVINCCDTDMAKVIIGNAYHKRTGIPFSVFTKQKTIYDKLHIRDCISPKIKFEKKEHNLVLKAFEKLTVKPLDPDDKASKFKYVMRSRYLEHTLGIGGIHSVNPSETMEDSYKYMYIDLDVRSYYPKIITEEKLFPKHLGPIFVDIYKEDIVDNRFKAIADKNELLAYMLKITANATFGLCDSYYSWLYDPKVAKSITVNGQLYLIMLLEWLESKTRCTVVYSNTDGLTVRIPRNEYSYFSKICDAWMNYTGFQLEFNHYKKMMFKDVNNYLIFTHNPDKPLKKKGSYEWKKPIQKGYNYPIVAKAIEDFYLAGIPIETTIRNCDDLFMFIKSERVDEKDFESIIVKPVKDSYLNDYVTLQKNNRWVVTRGNPDEGNLIKKRLSDGSIINLQLGKKVTIVNKILPDMTPSTMGIDYQFYEETAQKLINVSRRPAPEVRVFQAVQQKIDYTFVQSL